MATLSGELIIKVTFNNQHIPLGAYAEAIILQECINEIYKHRPLNDRFPKEAKRENFIVEVVYKEAKESGLKS